MPDWATSEAGARRPCAAARCREWLFWVAVTHLTPSTSNGRPLGRVGVGIMVAHNPLHRSGRAVLPHPALASGDDAKAPQGIGMTDASRGQPAVNEPPHPVPEDSTVLAAPRQHAVPAPADLEPKHGQRWAVHGHAVVTDVSTNNRAQPLAYCRDGVVHASLELCCHLSQLRLQTLAYRLPKHREHSVASLLRADMREAEKVEC